MSVSQQTADLRQAASEFQRYLSGDLSALQATDAFETLVALPPEAMARVIADWVHAQVGGHSSVPLSAYVFHSLKKVHELAEFDLVARDPLLRFIQALSRILVQVCPEAERAGLKMQLSRLGESEAAMAPRAQYILREGAAAGTEGGAPAPAPSDASTRRLELLLERLERLRPVSGGAAPAVPDTSVIAQALSTAAIDASSSAELERSLGRLRDAGVGAPLGQLFKALSENLPGWGLNLAGTETPAAAGDAKTLEAMRKIVALAPDAQEGAKRLGEMIYAAVERFNEGQLAQAVAMFDTASRLIDENKPDATMLKTLLGQAQSSLSEAVLRRFADAPEKQAMFRRVLQFFPALRPDALLESLREEPRRERRKALLALLEVHGPTCRAILPSRLAACASGEVPDPHGYVARNLVFLLRRIPRADEEPAAVEAALLARWIEPVAPAIVVKEAIGALAILRDPAAERALIARLKEMEAQAPARGAATEETLDLAERLCAALARQGTRDALRALTAHAFSRKPSLGDTMGRLPLLARHDLSQDPDLMAAVLAAARGLLPARVLGLVRKRPPQDATWVVQALAGTPHPDVAALLSEVAGRFQGDPLGDEAAKALAKLDAASKPAAQAPAPSEALSGDLELFGLPSLLQSLSDTQGSGEVVLFDRGRTKRAAIALHKGRIARCEAGALSGDAAIYQLLEVPFPGTFVFRTAAPRDGEPDGQDVLGLLLEGLRRHDELGPVRALVPDGIALESTGTAPQRPEDEADDAFVRAVWKQAAGGTPPETCEAGMKTDAYRVRRLYAMWLEQGALRVRAA